MYQPSATQPQLCLQSISNVGYTSTKATSVDHHSHNTTIEDVSRTFRGIQTQQVSPCQNQGPISQITKFHYHVSHCLACIGFCINTHPSSSVTQLFFLQHKFTGHTHDLSHKSFLRPEESLKLKAIQTSNPLHSGHSRVGKMLDHFKHQEPNGTHSCLVMGALCAPEIILGTE